MLELYPYEDDCQIEIYGSRFLLLKKKPARKIFFANFSLYENNSLFQSTTKPSLGAFCILTYLSTTYIMHIMVTWTWITRPTPAIWGTDRGTEPTVLLWWSEPWDDIYRGATEWDNILVSPWYSVDWTDRDALSAPTRWSRTPPTTTWGSRTGVSAPTWNNRPSV